MMRVSCDMCSRGKYSIWIGNDSQVWGPIWRNGWFEGRNIRKFCWSDRKPPLLVLVRFWYCPSCSVAVQMCKMSWMIVAVNLPKMKIQIWSMWLKGLAAPFLFSCLSQVSTRVDWKSCGVMCSVSHSFYHWDDDDISRKNLSQVYLLLFQTTLILSKFSEGMFHPPVPITHDRKMTTFD